MNKNANKIYRALNNPRLLLLFLLDRCAFLFSDRIFLKLKYWLLMNKPLDLNEPKTFTEKIQWLKLNDRNYEYVKMVDKYAVKDYVKSIIGEQYIIPTLRSYDDVESIDWSTLPNQFVMKCTHDSGGVVICKDKKNLDINGAINKLSRSLKNDYYRLNREWPYTHVPRRVIVEKYMEDSVTKDLKDYKWFCFNGKPRALFIASDRGVKNTETKFDFFDLEFNHLPFTNGHPNSNNIPMKPINFELMKQLASQLSHSIPHVRVDFYEIDGKVYFGELTFSHWSGWVPFVPEEWDYIFGEWLDLKSQK